MFLFCIVLAMSLCASVFMCFVVTCWERADLLALVSIPDLCTLTYFVSELSRRHGNHKPQCFDFLIECKLNDGACQFYFSHNENIHFSTQISNYAGCAFLKSFSI